MKDILIRITEDEKEITDFTVTKNISISKRKDGKFQGKTLNIQRIKDKLGNTSIRLVYSDKKGFLPFDNPLIPEKDLEYVKQALDLI